MRIGVLMGALIAAAGCTGSRDDAVASAPGSASPSASTGTPAPTPVLAGRSEERVLARLPVGPAAGTAVIDYSGVGEVRAAFRGTCSHAGETTRIQGTADTARFEVDVVPTGARLVLTDVGLSATSDLTVGRYVVSGHHLSLAAHLAHDGQAIGSVALEIDCGV